MIVLIGLFVLLLFYGCGLAQGGYMARRQIEQQLRQQWMYQQYYAPAQYTEVEMEVEVGDTPPAPATATPIPTASIDDTVVYEFLPDWFKNSK